MSNKSKLILEMFSYQTKWSMDDILEVQVPSPPFPTRAELETTVFRCVTDGQLYVDSEGFYSLLP